MSSSNKTPQQSQTPTQFRALSRNNSNTSTASSSNKGDFSSTISTANSVASSRSQLIDPRQLFATCGSSTPMRSFQRATISSVVKTRAFDNNPVLQGLLASSPSGQNSASNSQTPSPLSTPIFSRSRSLRMSGGPQRYRQSPAINRTSSRTPEIYSFNSGDISSYSNESQIKLVELNNEKIELKESLEFSECERQVLIDSAKELKETLQAERSQWKKEQDDLKKQITDSIAARVRAESQLTQNEVETNESRFKSKRLQEELSSRDKLIESLRKDLISKQRENDELIAMNNELRNMLKENLVYNGLKAAKQNDSVNQQVSDYTSIVTEMARLRLELNEKDKMIEMFNGYNNKNFIKDESVTCHDIDNLNKFLDDTVECIKGWPEELAESSQVQNLMKTLLGSYRADQNEMSLKISNMHL